MRLMRRPFGPLAGMLFALFGFWLQAGPVYAQSSGGAMDLFQGLTSDEQQAVLSKLGAGNLGGGTSTMNELPGQLGSSGSLNQAQQQEYQQEMAVRRQRAAEEQQPLIPELKGGDWVIVQIGFQLPPAVTNQQAQALQRLYSAQGGTPSAQSLQELQALQQGGGASGSGSALAQAAGTSAGSSAALTTEEKKKLQPLIDLLRSRNPYQLSPDGVLTLPGFAPIPLLGLTEQQATLRLQIVPDFENLQIRLTLLPLKKTGQQALKPFGYGLFAEYPSSFEPLTNVPVPSNYVIGPGDSLDVLLYGNQNHAYQMQVARDGQINFPELGPMQVAGQLFSSVAGEIESRVAHQMIGVRASVSMAETRSIQVFVMGEAFAPGAYTISGLGTITSALYAAGGVRSTGSLRNIQLRRGGALVGTLDLYDLLLHGNTTDDMKLLQGDVVFVPSVGPTVAIEGQVRRPAIYESKGEASPEQMVALAGGLSPNADVSKGTLTRIMPTGQRVVLPLDLTAGGESQGLHNGDLINIPRLRPTLESAVELQGHVFNPGSYFYRPGMRITDVIRSVDDLQPNSDLHYVLIRRELPPDLHVVALSADLAAALAAPGSNSDVPLMPRDQITVFDLSSSRDRIMQPVLEDLKSEATAEEPEQVVSIEGRVNVPGQYPLEPGMRVADLVRSGGGLAAAAYTGEAELTRYVVASGGTRQTQIIDVDLMAALSGNPTANLTLEPYDVLSIKEVSQWTSQDTITLKGEVRFPGTYTIKPGETLKSVMERAGGFTPYAFPQGAVFTRAELRVREQQEMDDLAERMRVELGVLALRAVASSTGGNGGGDASNALIVGRSLLQQLQGEKAVGRLVINLTQIVRQGMNSRYDVILRDGDELIVPKFEQEVTVIGEVQDPTSHLYNPDLTREDYIRLSGGLTSQADGKRVYVVRADGSVVASGGSRWFNGGGGTEMKPGDTIVVPINAEEMLPLPFWQAVTTILYNVAIAVAAVHAL
jgi:protein involved in polysaccharide export with SLBB domain